MVSSYSRVLRWLNLPYSFFFTLHSLTSMPLLLLLFFIVLIYVAILIRPVIGARRRRNKHTGILDSEMLFGTVEKKGPDKK